MRKRRILSLLTALALCLCLLPATALAGERVKYLDADGKTQTCTSATVVESSAETDQENSIIWSAGWYAVNDDDVIIASRITVTGDVHLILVDDKTLTASKGIYVGSGASLTIYGQSTGDDAGKLIARAHQVGSCAGIGGNTDDNAAHGDITINGGIITAESFGDAAAIGSGSGTGASGKSNGTITINGGKVTATAGGSNGAGIGGGYANNIAGGNIVITGGTVTAKGAKWAAGIGGGYTDYQKNGRKITITGTADVSATGGDNAAGIGCGYNNANKSIGGIIINGQAKVKATGGENAAGIGGSYASGGTMEYDSSTGTIEWVNVKTTGPIRIGGSAKVTATGGGGSYGGAGIGAGGSGAAGDIYITGGTVNATGGACTDDDEYHGAGIGSGNRGVSGTITISAGVVTAESGGAGADGIGQGGSGRGGDFSTVNGTNPGKAVIYTDSISDAENTSDWNGIVFLNNEGTVYGDVTLNRNLAVKKSQILTVPEKATLTLADGKKLTVNGELIVEEDGTLVNNGELVNNGTTTIAGTLSGSGTTSGSGRYPVTKVTLNKTELSLTVGDSETLIATVKPDNASNKDVTWESRDETVATVDNGTVTAVAAGTATITVTTQDGSKTASCEVTVAQQPKEYIVQVSASPAEGGAVSGGGTYEKDDSVTVIAVANPGYHFVSWTENGEAVSTDSSYTFAAAADRSLTAVFEKNEPETYTVTILNGGFGAKGAGSYREGDSVYLYAGRRTDYEFIGWWSSDVTVEDADSVHASFIMPDHNVVVEALWYKEDQSPSITLPTHGITVDGGSHGDVEVWPEEAKMSTTVTITATPDKGYEVDEVIVTDENGKEIAVTEKDNGKYTFRMPGSDVTIEVTFQPVSDSTVSGGDLTVTAPAGWVNPYTDVTASAWYYDAVGFASANGLMGGTSATTFAPESPMNRAMVWTVIARLAGQTISGATWAEDAKAWVVAQGVSDGTNPDGNVTREELVTMLYRYAGSPEMNVPELALIGGYPDSVDVSAWAQDAFAWAISKGVIEGRDGKLAAGESITRAEAATILARFHMLTK